MTEAMSPHLFLLASVLLLFIGQLCIAHVIDCSKTDCRRKFINCLPREDCFVSCMDSRSCVGSIINCPINGNCTVECRGVQSCEDVTIDATLSSGKVDVLCDNIHRETTDIDECRGLKIFGSTINRNADNCLNVSCIGNYRSCINSEIYCPFNGNCSISCNGDTSCKYSEIVGPVNGYLDLNCNGPTSCYNSLINGAESNKLQITGCKEHESCLDLSIYCPPNTNGIKNCFIEGNDNLGRDKVTSSPTATPTIQPTIPTMQPTYITNAPTISPTISPTLSPTNVPSRSPTPYPGDGLVIYAINGWKDLEINYSGTFGVRHEGKMVCGYDYGVSCKIAHNAWSCANINEHCGGDIIYSIPSTHSTAIPSTIAPITPSIPSSYATKVPTIYPTKPTTISSIPSSTTYYKPSITTTKSPDIIHEETMDYVIKTTNQTIDYYALYYRERQSGEIMVIIGCILVFLTCVIVTCAAYTKQRQQNEYLPKPSTSIVTITAENPDTDNDETTDSESSSDVCSYSSDCYDPKH